MGLLFRHLEVMDVVGSLHPGHQLLCDLSQGREEECGVVTASYSVKLPIEDHNRGAHSGSLPLIDVKCGLELFLQVKIGITGR